jgi:hypothetical protein
MSFTRIVRQLCGWTMVLFLVTACGGAQPGPTTETKPPTATPEAVPPTPAATPTPTTALLPQADEQTPTPPPPSGGEVEIRIPFDIFSQGEQPPADMPECIETIPFRMFQDGPRTMLEGEGQIDCTFVDTPQGSPITYHVILQMDAHLDGELLPPTTDKPSGWLDAYLLVDGATVQYYTGYPPEAVNPCPESSPCRTPASDTILLPFAYEDGSTLTTPWTFILRLP